MNKRIAIIQGHPDASERHFGHALAEAYANAARGAGHEVTVIEVARLEFPVVRSDKEWHQPAPPAIAQVQETIRWAEHVVIFYPMWMGAMPAMLKAFLEQLLRPGYAFEITDRTKFPKKLLTGRSARIVVTMGMPGFIYKLFYRAHTLKNLERNILGAVGFKPIHSTVIGSVEEDGDTRADWLGEMADLGAKAE